MLEGVSRKEEVGLLNLSIRGANAQCRSVWYWVVRLAGRCCFNGWYIVRVGVCNQTSKYIAVGAFDFVLIDTHERSLVLRGNEEQK